MAFAVAAGGETVELARKNRELSSAIQIMQRQLVEAREKVALQRADAQAFDVLRRSDALGDRFAGKVPGVGAGTARGAPGSASMASGYAGAQMTGRSAMDKSILDAALGDSVPLSVRQRMADRN